jgi:hypothetical protein
VTKLSAEAIRAGDGPAAVGSKPKRGRAHNSETVRPLSDAAIRAALRIALSSTTMNPRDFRERALGVECPPYPALLIEELPLGGGYVRADLAVVAPRSLHIYEIKSDLDRMDRLAEQMRSYNEIADYVTLVVGWSHAAAAMRIVPPWWEIWLAERDSQGEVSFVPLRASGTNRDIHALSIALLFRREEALNLLNFLGASAGVRSKPLRVLCERIASALAERADMGLALLREHMHSCLIHRVPRSVQLLPSDGG